MNFIVPFAMKVIAFDVAFIQFLIAYFSAFLIHTCIDPRMDFQSRFRVVVPIDSTTISNVSNGVPCQFRVIWQNSRCSILFHLLVPGG